MSQEFHTDPDQPAFPPFGAATCSTACITRVGRSPDGKAFVVYLRDGMKISVGRDKRTKGPAWLEVKEQSKLVAQ
jgi:hypothetical protein